MFCRTRVPHGSIWKPHIHYGQRIFSQSFCPPVPWLLKTGYKDSVLYSRAPEQPRGNICQPGLMPWHPLPEPSPADFPAMPPALGISHLGSWAVQSPMVSVCWHLTKSHCALVVDRVPGCSRVVTFHGRVQAGVTGNATAAKMALGKTSCGNQAASCQGSEPEC